MTLEITPISIEEALALCKQKGQWQVMAPEGHNSFAIAVKDDLMYRGTIIVDAAAEARLHHLYTDATSQAGTLLYGAAWRAAKALGYKSIEL